MFCFQVRLLIKSSFRRETSLIVKALLRVYMRFPEDCCNFEEVGAF